MQELFANKIHFFKFLSTTDKPRLWVVKNSCTTASRIVVQASFRGFIGTRKGKYQQRMGNTLC